VKLGGSLGPVWSVGCEGSFMRELVSQEVVLDRVRRPGDDNDNVRVTSNCPQQAGTRLRTKVVLHTCAVPRTRGLCNEGRFIRGILLMAILVENVTFRASHPRCL